jgi:hypothetical protein
MAARGHLASRQGLDDVDGGAVRDLVTELVPIRNLISVDEGRHVLSKAALIVEHVPAGPAIPQEVAVKHLAERGAVDLTCRAGHVTLDVLRESNGNQRILVRPGAEFPSLLQPAKGFRPSFLPEKPDDVYPDKTAGPIA